MGAGTVRNVLLVTLDQLRGDTMGCAGHPLVRTPTLDALAADGVRFDRHYSQASPCGPGRACLYTGTYQMNNRVVGNGSPLDRRFDNVALAARRAGYEPAVFGYTDQAVDPRDTTGSDDPRLSTYEGILAGFDPVLDLSCGNVPWLDWLAGMGVDVSGGDLALLATEAERPVEQSLSTFTTDRAVDWLRRQDRPVVRPRLVPPSPPAQLGGRGVGSRPTTRRPWPIRSRRPTTATSSTTSPCSCRSSPRRPTSTRSAGCARSTSAWCRRSTPRSAACSTRSVTSAPGTTRS